MPKLMQVPEDTMRALLRMIYVYSSGNADVPPAADLAELLRLVSVDADPIFGSDATRVTTRAA